jgi:hypothetical protein
MSNKQSRSSQQQPVHRYTARELEIFASMHRAHVMAQATTRVGRYICAVLMVGFVSWAVVHSIEAVAGKITMADIRATLSLSTSEEAGSGIKKALKYARLIYEVLAPLCGIIGIWYARRTRKREEDTVIQFAPFRLMHEAAIDPLRTSSGLGRDGRTPSEERS